MSNKMMVKWRKLYPTLCRVQQATTMKKKRRKWNKQQSRKRRTRINPEAGTVVEIERSPRQNKNNKSHLGTAGLLQEEVAAAMVAENHLLEAEPTRAVAEAVENQEGVETVDLGEAGAAVVAMVGVEAMVEVGVEVTIGADAAMIEVLVGGGAAEVLDPEKIVAEGKEEGVETIMTTGNGGVDARCDHGRMDSSAWGYFWLVNHRQIYDNTINIMNIRKFPTDHGPIRATPFCILLPPFTIFISDLSSCQPTPLA